MKKTIISIIVVLIIIIAGAWYFSSKGVQAPAGPAGSQPATGEASIVASYACDAGKTIQATYTDASSTPPANPGEPPVPGGSVALTLSDGRTMTLPQTISGSGVRYANADESVVFWNKGNGAFMMENNQQTYTGCIEVAKDPGGLPMVFESGSEGFSLRYPDNFTVDDSYKYQALGPGKDIGGVKFTINPAIATGTNLGGDSYISVEEIPQAQSCSADLFLDSGMGAKASEVTQGDTTYSVASSTGAGAGNRYEETVYAIPGTNPCIAVRYFIHYGVIENYPAGTVKEFDEGALKGTFDKMRSTLTIGQ